MAADLISINATVAQTLLFTSSFFLGNIFTLCTLPYLFREKERNREIEK